MINFKPILYVLGILLTALSSFMLIPAFFDYFYDNENWVAFLLSSFITSFIGINLIFTNKGYQGRINIKQAFILTSFSWFLLASFSSLPFIFSTSGLDFTDSYFEAMSGLTTTGATIIQDLERMSRGILIWRSLLQWIGGVGIIVVALAILPMLNIGGMQLFKTESSDRSEKILPRTAQVSMAIAGIYLFQTLLCFILLNFAGMNDFDALNHAFTTVSTAGFSTHNESIAYFDNVAIEVIMTSFMLLGGIPFVLFIAFIQGNIRIFSNNSQIRNYLYLIGLSVFVLSLWLVQFENMNFTTAIRYASFNLISVITTSGFASYDYAKWLGLPLMMIFMLSVVGGCTGSTSGGIKIFRFEILFITAKNQIAKLIQPNSVIIPKYDGKLVSKEIVTSIMGFMILFAISFIFLALILSLANLDFLTSISGAAAILSNLGPALGDVIGPAGNYSSLPDFAKWALAFAMLVGRLEIYTMLVLFSARFWND